MALVDLQVHDRCPLCSHRFIEMVDLHRRRWRCADPNRTVVLDHPESHLDIIKIQWPLEEKTPVENRYPHKCQACGGKCYIGFNKIEHPPGAVCR